MTASKLPEWPEEPGLCGTSHDWLNYHALVSYAALARMEALEKYVMHSMDCNAGDKWPCTCGLSELLAACARKEAGK